MKTKLSFRLCFIMFIFILGFFLRAYNIENRMAFSTDQGIDILKVWEKTHQKKLYYLGPKASVSLFHMGPFYYYWITPAVVLANYHPISPALFVAFIESITPITIFFFCLKFFNKKSAYYSSLLYAVSPLAITFSSFAWNPNTIPFFVMLILYFLFLYLKDKNELNFVSAFIIFSLAFQLHYQMLIIGIFFAFVFFKQPLKKIKNYIFCVGGFSLAFFPYFLYEVNNNFYNLKAIYAFFSQSHSQYYNRVGNIDFVINFLPNFYSKIIGGYNLTLGLIIFIGSLLTIFYYGLYKKQKYFSFLLAFIIICLIGLRIYKGDKLDYYLAFMFVLPVLSTGIVLGKIKFKLLNKINLSFLIIMFIVVFNLLKTPLIINRNLVSSYKEAESLALKILDLSQGKKYALELNSRFYNPPVRYLLTYWNQKPVESGKAEIAIKICSSDKTCDDKNDPNKKDFPAQLLQTLDLGKFNNQPTEFKDSNFYFYIYEKEK
jgi:hypothetical protein